MEDILNMRIRTLVSLILGIGGAGLAVGVALTQIEGVIVEFKQEETEIYMRIETHKEKRLLKQQDGLR